MIIAFVVHVDVFWRLLLDPRKKVACFLSWKSPFMLNVVAYVFGNIAQLSLSSPYGKTILRVLLCCR